AGRLSRASAVKTMPISAGSPSSSVVTNDVTVPSPICLVSPSKVPDRSSPPPPLHPESSANSARIKNRAVLLYIEKLLGGFNCAESGLARVKTLQYVKRQRQVHLAAPERHSMAFHGSSECFELHRLCSSKD